MTKETHSTVEVMHGVKNVTRERRTAFPRFVSATAAQVVQLCAESIFGEISSAKLRSNLGDDLSAAQPGQTGNRHAAQSQHQSGRGRDWRDPEVVIDAKRSPLLVNAIKRN